MTYRSCDASVISSEKIDQNGWAIKIFNKTYFADDSLNSRNGDGHRYAIRKPRAKIASEHTSKNKVKTLVIKSSKNFYQF